MLLKKKKKTFDCEHKYNFNNHSLFKQSFIDLIIDYHAWSYTLYLLISYNPVKVFDSIMET
jgi:hypothetical protein